MHCISETISFCIGVDLSILFYFSSQKKIICIKIEIYGRIYSHIMSISNDRRPAPHLFIN